MSNRCGHALQSAQQRCTSLNLPLRDPGSSGRMTMGTPARPRRRLTRSKSFLADLYEGTSRRSTRFRYALLLFDVATIGFLAVTSFNDRSTALEVVDAVIGIIILADFVARLSLSRHRVQDILHPLGLADIAVIVSFLAPVSGSELAFLRSLRMLRLFRSYRLASRMKRDFPFVRRNYDTIVAGTHLFVFLFVMTAVVYETQHGHNPAIANYVDALYFTVTTLTTTGFGDITLPGTTGRLLSIVMMIVGVSLFVRLVQVLFQARRVHHRCTSCGLSEHEHDAVHCKRCGTLLHLAT
jgi:voltage-gated potassium channel